MCVRNVCLLYGTFDPGSSTLYKTGDLMQCPKLCMLVFALALSVMAQTPDSLFKAAEQRMASYAAYDTLKMRSVSKEIECDKHWRPKKIIHIEKRVLRVGEREDINILAAWEEKKDRRKDVTETVRKKTIKEMKKQRKRRESHHHSENCDHAGEGRRMSVGLSTMLPDSAERALYTFTVVKDTLIDARSAICIHGETEAESDSLYEGLYYLDKERGDLLMMDVKPAKYPGMVKAMRMKMQFDILPGNYFVLKQLRIQAHASIVLKTWRMRIEEDYSDFEVTAAAD